MTQCPISAAKAATPWWMMEILDYNGLEVHPVHEEVDPETDDSTCESCQAPEAHFWAVYGHLKTGGINCFEDFPTREKAYAFAEKLLKVYSHLREYGLS